jgi:hypothetical protein
VVGILSDSPTVLWIRNKCRFATEVTDTEQAVKVLQGVVRMVERIIQSESLQGLQVILGEDWRKG